MKNVFVKVTLVAALVGVSTAVVAQTSPPKPIPEKLKPYCYIDKKTGRVKCTFNGPQN